jgi:hypothetical protein
MIFNTSLISAQEAHQIASSEPTDFHTRVLIISAINTAVDADAFTATVVVSGATESIRLMLLDELNQIGYTIDGTTTPGSWIITW